MINKPTQDEVPSAAEEEAAPPNPLRVGVTPWLKNPAGNHKILCRQAILAEDLGFDSFFLPESHFLEKGAIPAPFLWLAAVASVTKKIRLGTTSYLLPIRQALLVAEQAAVLDRLSEGRLILGLGRGFRKTLFEVFEVPPKEKRPRFEAAVERMIAAWTQVDLIESTAEGEPAVRLSPGPVQKPHPPLWVAAFGPKALAQAGRLGLPYLASPIEPLSRLVENQKLHQAALLEHGHRVSGRAVPIMRTVFVSRKAEERESVRSRLLQQSQALRSSRAKTLRESATDEVSDWAIVVGPEELSEGLDRYRDALGMTDLILRVQVPGVSTESLEWSLAAIAEQVGERTSKD